MTNLPAASIPFFISFQTALLTNTLVCLPTGLGKTLIAAVVMHNFARWFPEVGQAGMRMHMIACLPLPPTCCCWCVIC